MKRTIPKIHLYNNYIVNHIKENFGLYFVCIFIFVIGIIIGVILVNNRTNNQKESTANYINESILMIKEDNSSISKFNLLKKSLTRNALVILCLWVLGLTFFGKYALYMFLFIFGITFGYTYSSIISSLPLMKGIIFILSSMFLQNAISIPSIIFLCVQGITCFKIFDSKHCNYNRIIIRYTAYCMLVAIVLFTSSFVESFISTNIVCKISKYL